MGGDLLIPRCEVYWGDENITFFEGEEKWPGSDGPQPLVYNVKVSIHEEGQTPSGSMSWNPSALAYKEYERLVRDKYDQTIVVRYYYPGGSAIAFSFVWAGQSESYGRNMDITVRLYSELDGLYEGYVKNIVQVGEGVTLFRSLTDLEILFGVKGGVFKDKPGTLIKFADRVAEDLKGVKVLSNYSEGSTFSQSVENVVGQNGNIAFFHNLVSRGPSNGVYVKSDLPGVVIFPPYTWVGNKMKNGSLVRDPEVSDDTLRGLVRYRPPIPDPDYQYVIPTLRNGYFLGPAMIDSLVKTSEWSPGQKTRRNTRSTNPKIQKFVYTQDENGLTINTTATQEAQKQVAESAKRSNGAGGSHGSMSRPGMRLEGNEEGEFKKQLLQSERTAKLSASLFMCPALTGIKPCDIVFIPSFSGESLEDWIVNSVEYEQNDGGVNISIQASRTYGLGTFMNPTVGYYWLRYAVELFGLVGEYGSIENWVRYAWSFEDLMAYNVIGPGTFKKNSEVAAAGQPQPLVVTTPVTTFGPATAPSPSILSPNALLQFNTTVRAVPGYPKLITVGELEPFNKFLRDRPQLSKPVKAPSNRVPTYFGIGIEEAKTLFKAFPNRAR
jgi:hypothetical protein